MEENWGVSFRSYIILNNNINLMLIALLKFITNVSVNIIDFCIT